MSTTAALFHTATFEHEVPGEHADLAAVAYNLQYTHALVDKAVASNPPTDTDVQTIRAADHQLVRANHYGVHPNDESQRICAIGIGDVEDRAIQAADDAWFDYHATIVFANKVGPDNMHRLSFRRPVPGAAPQRAAIVGVLYDLEFMRPIVEAAVTRNRPTHDEYVVVEAGDVTLMRVNLYGHHPLESGMQICVGGIADRHYRAVAGAEQAWSNYHTSLLFGARAIGSF
jgi:hypothetical protein